MDVKEYSSTKQLLGHIDHRLTFPTLIICNEKHNLKLFELFLTHYLELQVKITVFSWHFDTMLQSVLDIGDSDTKFFMCLG